MNPGDLIEWVYKHDGTVVDKDEIIYSSIMKQWVPVGGIAILVSYVERKYTWLSEKGLFHLHKEDMWSGCSIKDVRMPGAVIPHAVHSMIMIRSLESISRTSTVWLSLGT